MTIIKYNKLVRDKIPEIIEKAGKKCVCETLSEKEYIQKLNEKLEEEVKEYLASESVEELADIAEVIHAILDFKKLSLDQLQEIKKVKAEKRGRFEKRIFLKSVIEN